MHILCAKLAGKDEIAQMLQTFRRGGGALERVGTKPADFGITCCRLVAALDEIELDDAGKRKL